MRFLVINILLLITALASAVTAEERSPALDLASPDITVRCKAYALLLTDAKLLESNIGEVLKLAGKGIPANMPIIGFDGKAGYVADCALSLLLTMPEKAVQAAIDAAAIRKSQITTNDPAAILIRALGAKAPPLLLGKLSRDDRFEPAAILLGFCTSESVPLLCEEYRSLAHYPEEAQKRRKIVHALGVIRSSLAEETLISALNDKDESVAIEAASSLAALGEPALKYVALRHAKATRKELKKLIDMLNMCTELNGIHKRFFRSISGETPDAEPSKAVFDAARADAAKLAGIHLPEISTAIVTALSYTDDDLNAAALIAARYFCGADIRELLADKCVAKNARVRERAVEAVCFVGDYGFWTIMNITLADADPRVRIRSLTPVRMFVMTDTIDKVIANLDAGEASLRLEAAQAAYALGVTGRKALLDYRSKMRPDIKTAALKLLAEANDPDLFEPALAAFIQETDSVYSENLLKLLLAIPSPSSVDKMMKLAEEGTPRVRAGALLWLGKFGGDDAYKPLEAVAKDEDVTIRRAAIAALYFHSTIAFDLLVRALEDPDRYVRAYAVRALANAKHERLPDVLIYALSDPDSEVRKLAAKSLITCGNKRVEFRVAAALVDPNDLVRQYCATALNAWGTEASKKALIYGLEDPNAITAGICADTVCKLKLNDGIKRIRELITDPTQHSDLKLALLPFALPDAPSGWDGQMLAIATIDKLPALRSAAIEAIAALRPAVSVDIETSILALMYDTEVSVRMAAFKTALGGPYRTTSILRALFDLDEQVRNEAISMLEGRSIEDTLSDFVSIPK